MSVPFFEFEKKPFFPAPLPQCFVPLATHLEALGRLVDWALNGDGVGILTAPAGVGKTLLCQVLAERIRDRFETLLLPNAQFETQKELLQSLLYHLKRPYSRLDEHELRLELFEAVGELEAENRQLLLIVDEAHDLSEEMLQELRLLASLSDAGDPGVRMLLSGQLELEELLTRRSLSALNQRVTLHEILEPLTRDESARYLDERLTWAGADIEAVFTEEAVSLMVHVADGVPRCLNQIAESVLKLAAARKTKPVTAGIVREAFEEIRHLPLHWNDLPDALDEPPAVTHEPESHADGADEPAPTESVTPPPPLAEAAADDEIEYVVAEFGAGIDDSDSVTDEPETPYSVEQEVGIASEDTAIFSLKDQPPPAPAGNPPLADVPEFLVHPRRFPRTQNYERDVQQAVNELRNIARQGLTGSDRRESSAGVTLRPSRNPVAIFAADIESLLEAEAARTEASREEAAAAPAPALDEHQELQEIQRETEELRQETPGRMDVPEEPAATIEIGDVEADDQGPAPIDNLDAVVTENPDEYDVVQPERPSDKIPFDRTPTFVRRTTANPARRYRNLFRELRRRMGEED